MVGALLRLADSQGGFGTVIARGDERAGSILVLLVERGRPALSLERVLQPSGRYTWGESLLDGTEAELDALLARRRRFDPDLWVVELDIASAERFAAEMKQLD